MIVTRNEQNPNMSALKLLLENGANVNCKVSNLSLLFRAVFKNNLKYAKFLIMNGAYPNVDESAAVIAACRNGDLKMLRLLLTNGGNINPKSESTIIEACKKDQSNIIRFLIDEGAYFHLEYDCDSLPRKNEIDNRNVLILKHLWSTDNMIGRVCDEIIQLSCRKNDFDLINFLIAKGINKKILSIIGLTHALELHNYAIAANFINLGADIHLDADNLFRWACACRHYETMSFLLSYGANINANNGEPLLNACDQGDIKTIQYLVSHNADVNINDGRSILLACTEIKERLSKSI